MDIIRTALLGATALSLTVGLAATTAVAGPNDNAKSALYHGRGIPQLPGTRAKKDKIVYDAVVNSDGSLARGTGATGSSLIATGAFEVDFKSDVQGCAYVATIGNATYGTAPAGFISEAERSGNPDGVWVNTYNSSGTLTDIQFHLVVACP